MEGRWLGKILAVASFVAVVQLALSVLSLAYKWDDQYAYARRSAALNTRLRRQYERLVDDKEWHNRERVAALQEQDTELHIEDEAHAITDDERHMGMRFSLLQYNKACIACGNTPRSMRPTTCGVCGSFKRGRF